LRLHPDPSGVILEEPSRIEPGKAARDAAILEPMDARVVVKPDGAAEPADDDARRIVSRGPGARVRDEPGALPPEQPVGRIDDQAAVFHEHLAARGGESV